MSVCDNGVGIPASMLTNIFEPFARVSRTPERGERGLGIGLTIAKKLVELHGGRLEALSEGPDQGCEFLIRLPLIRPQPAVHQSDEPGAARSVSRKILIADDNHDAAVSLGMLLELMGHETRMAHDGAEAVEIAEHFHPDVVLLDLGMPKLDGYEAARRIAARPWARSSVLVAVTGGDRRLIVRGPVRPDSIAIW